jgi:hypothetical protein
MAIQRKKKEIGGVAYHVTQMDVETALSWQPVLFEAAGEALGSVGKTNPALIKELSAGSLAVLLGPAISALMRSLGPRYRELVSAFAANTQVALKQKDGQLELKELTSAVQNELWVGAYNHQLTWFLFCLEQNFGSFFGGLLEAKPGEEGGLEALTKRLSSLLSHQSSTGVSGGSQPAAS